MSSTFYTPKRSIYKFPIILVSFIFFLLFSLQLNAQYIKQFILGESVYTLEANLVPNRPTNVKIYLGNEKSSNAVSFDFYSQSYMVFNKNLSNALKKVTEEAKGIFTTDWKPIIDLYADEAFKGILLYEVSLETETPRAGYIRLFSGAIVEPTYPFKTPKKKNEKIDLLVSTMKKNRHIMDDIFTNYLLISSAKPEGFIKSMPNDPKSYDDILLNYFNDILQNNHSPENDQPGSNPTEGKAVKRDSVKDVAQIANDIYDPSKYQKTIKTKKELDIYLSTEFNRSANLNVLLTRSNEQRHLAEELIRARKDQDSISNTLSDLPYQISKLSKPLTDLIDTTLNNYRHHNLYFGAIKDFSPAYKQFRSQSKLFRRLASMDNTQLQTQLKLIADSVVSLIDLTERMYGILDLSIDSIDGDYQSNYYLQQEINDRIQQLTSMLSDTASKFTPAEKTAINNSIKLKNDSVTKMLKEISVHLLGLRGEVSSVKITLKSDLLKPFTDFNKLLYPYILNAQKLDSVHKIVDKKQKSLNDLLNNPQLFRIDSLQVEFNQGILKNIIVEGNYHDTILSFSNPMRIPFTSITHYEKLKGYDLNDIYSQRYKIKMTDVLKYVPVLHVNAEDYSPYDSVYHMKIRSDTTNIVVAMKEKVRQILVAKAFTDLIGLTADQPNGLIQFEISKKISLFTNRWKYNHKYRSFFSYLTYYEPVFTFSKLEQNNKYFYVSSNDLNTNKGEISTIDLYKYSSIRFKVINLNLLNWEISDIKSAFEINGGCSLLYTPIRDSINKKNNVIQWGAISGMPFAECRYVLKPDVRYGLSISVNFGRLYLWDNNLTQINDPQNPYNSDSYNRNLLTFQFDAFYRPFLRSESGAFFRVLNVHSFPMSNTYLQIQIGYAFNILKSAGKK